MLSSYRPALALSILTWINLLTRMNGFSHQDTVYTEKESAWRRMAQRSRNEVAGLFGESASDHGPGPVIGMSLENTGFGLVSVFAILLLKSFYDSPLLTKKKKKKRS